MALYIGEDEIWKCPKHPSKRRRNTTGICSTCLRERLGILCPNCANIRPCSCCSTATSSSSSSSFSLFSSSSRTTAPYESATINDDQPKLLKSRSVAVPSMRSRFSTSMRENIYATENKAQTRSFWGNFKSNKSRKGGDEVRKDGHEESKDDNFEEKNLFYNSKIGEFDRMIMKSRSMRAPITLKIDGGEEKGSTKGKSWHFPSPIKIFRNRSKVVQDRSPLQGY